MRLRPSLALFAVAAMTALAQRPEFEVASIKLNTTDGRSDGNGPLRSGKRIEMHNVQPYSVIFYAFHLTGSYQIEGYVPLPEGWNWYDIEARTDPATTDDQLRLMFQSLLEDRFKLKYHRVTKDVPALELTVKDKARLTPAREGPMTVTIEGRTLSQREGTCGTSLWKSGNHMVCHAASMDKIVAQIGNLLRSPITDRTGITGSFDLHLVYLPEERILEVGAPPVPSLQDAIQDVGLRIEKGKAPIEVLVIDQFQKPSDN